MHRRCTSGPLTYTQICAAWVTYMAEHEGARFQQGFLLSTITSLKCHADMPNQTSVIPNLLLC